MLTRFLCSLLQVIRRGEGWSISEVVRMAILTLKMEPALLLVHTLLNRVYFS